jgi:predicted nuclease with TOPRIM domain
MPAEWLAAILPFVSDAKVSAILREQVRLLEMQRDDAIRELEKADSALAEVVQKIADLQGENAKLQQKIDRLQPTGDLSDEATKILLHFFKENRFFAAEEIAQIFEMSPGIAKHHCDTLHRKKLLGIAGDRIAPFSRAPLRLEITPLGREYIVEGGLA